MAYYKDLREFIQVLEKSGNLRRIKREINKDFELQPLFRWQFRGLPENERKAFLFENVTDVKGRKYDIPVLIGAHAASTEIYAKSMMCQPNQIPAKWEEAQLHPIKPRIVESGPVQEEVHMGDTLLEHGGMDEFPVPISTPGFDVAPYITAGNSVSKDPETGTYNIGNYRIMVKSQSRLGISAVIPAHLRRNRDLYKERGVPMPVAVVIGPAPNIGLVSVTSLPYEVDEYDVAGGIAGEPVELVKCKTVDLEVPATAEIVIEGEVSIDYLEKEAPFGEYCGYIGLRKQKPVLNITAITHRRRPIFNAFLCQFPPSESSTLRGIGCDAAYYKFLRYDLSLQNVVDVAFHRESGAWQFCVISLRNPSKTDVWRALYGASAFDPQLAKIIVAVDDDVNPRHADSILWALCFRMRPDHDIRIVPHKTASLDYSAVPMPEIEARVDRPPTAGLLIDATRDWPYPPVSLPKKEFMERARQIWEEEGLPPLTPKVPWYGYSLGYWPEEYEQEAELALKGEHYKTGEKLEKTRIKG